MASYRQGYMRMTGDGLQWWSSQEDYELGCSPNGTIDASYGETGSVPEAKRLTRRAITAINQGENRG